MMAGFAGVTLTSENWYPLTNERSTLSPYRDLCSRASVSFSSPALSRSSGTGIDTNSEESENSDRPADWHKAIDILRQYVRAGRIHQKLMAQVLEEADVENTGSLSVPAFSDAVQRAGLVVRKIWMRPLKKNKMIFRDEFIQLEEFLDLLNLNGCWPAALESEIAYNSQPQLDLLTNETIPREPIKLEFIESISFGEVPSETFEQDAITEAGTEIMAIETENANAASKLSKFKVLASPYQRTSNKTMRLWHLPKIESPTGKRTPKLETLTAERGRRPDTQLPKIKSSLVEKGYGYANGNSKARALQYAVHLEAADSPMRKSLQYTTKFWRRSPFPAHAVEYRRWHLLKTVLPGFSDPKQVPKKASAIIWEDPRSAPLKYGIGSAEPLHKASLQIYSQKRHRCDINRALKANVHLQKVRKQITTGEYDHAIECATHALKLNPLESISAFEISGPSAQAVLAEPAAYVAEMMKREIAKLLKAANHHLERQSFQRARSHLPFLRHACQWLSSNRVADLDSLHDEELKCYVEKIDNLTQLIIAAEKTHALAVEMASLGSYFANARREFELSTIPIPDDLDLEEKNNFPSALIADGKPYRIMCDVKPSTLPDQLNMGTKLIIRGAATLGSGRKDDGSKARRGTVNAFNERSSKYKVQYTDDYEWISWPPQLLVRIDIDPEEAVIEVPGFSVRSKTVDRTKYQVTGEGILVIDFIVTPQGPPLDFTNFGNVIVTVKGLKSGKSLLKDSESCQAQIRPPTFMVPSRTYLLYDAVSRESLGDGVVEFFNKERRSSLRFQCGQQISNLQDGLYTISFGGTSNFDGSGPTSSYRIAVVMKDAADNFCKEMSKIFLNPPVCRPDQLRVVVTWGHQPLELDLHVYSSAGLHVDYQAAAGDVNKSFVNENKYVRFEMDTCAGCGPETATITVKKSSHYSFSVHNPDQKGDTSWVESLAVVSLFDSSGLFAMFHVPHGNELPKSNWWHVFALDGNQWQKQDHGILRINQISSEEMPQYASPGWKIIETARQGSWDEFDQHLMDIVGGRSSKDCQMFPQDLANIISREGDTLIGLICSHNEDPGAQDFPAGDNKGAIPLQKQIRSLELFLKESGKRANSGESLMSGGLPTLETFRHECRLRGISGTFIYRAIVDASTPVAVYVLNHVTAFVRRCQRMHGYRKFFEREGDSLLLACIEKRNEQSLLPVLRALLANESVWFRRANKKFQKDDPVLIEYPPGCGDWFEGIVEQVEKSPSFSRPQRSFSVRFYSRHQKTKDVSVQGNCVTEEGNVVVSHVSVSNLRWRSYAVDHARVRCRKYQEHLLTISSYKYQRDRAALRTEVAELSKLEAICKEALGLLLDKAYL